MSILEKMRAIGNKPHQKLAKALVSHNLVQVKQLLEQGVDPNIFPLGQGGEPLIFRVFEKSSYQLPPLKFGDRPQTRYRMTANRECLRLLLAYGANVNTRDSQGRTALEIAILWCLPEIVKLLLLHGADPNLRDPHHFTPLMKATRWGIQDSRPTIDKLQIIRHLLDSGADIDARTPEGQTALMMAVGNSRLEIAEFLVFCGASLQICDRQGNRATDIISQHISPTQQTYLRKILTQPQLNLVPDKYQQLIPEGDRLLAPLINKIIIRG